MKAVLGLALAFLAVTPLQAQPQPMAYDKRGPEAIVSDPGGPTCTIFRPKALAAGGRKNPVILWGNGTGAQPVGYRGILQSLASWGFVVAAANTPNAGSGQDMLACLDWLTAENARAGGPFEGKLDLEKVGASGHSQGGGGALLAGRDPRVKATAPLMPATGGPRYAAAGQPGQHGPMLLLSGSADRMTPPERSQQPVFDKADTPVVWATLVGAGHLAPMNDGGPFPGIVTAWFRWTLLGDSAAKALFEGEACGYCRNLGWTIRRKGGV
jgi:predicted dienelactone hydrolase